MSVRPKIGTEMSLSSSGKASAPDTSALSAAASLVADLESRGVRLSARADDLIVDAPAGTLSPELRQSIKALKPDILRLLAEGSGSAPAPAFAQERIAYLEMLEPGTAVYNLPATFDVARDVSVEEVLISLTALCSRHEVLRTRVHISGGGLSVQLGRVDPEVLRNAVEVLSPGENVQRAFINRPFTLERESLFRVGVQARKGSTTLIFVFHHIIMDGLSVRRFAREFFSLLATGGVAEGGGADAVPGYYRFALEQKRAHASRRAEQSEFWRRYLNGIEEHLTLLATRESEESHGGDRVRSLVLEAQAEKFRALAASRGATLFQALLTVYALALEIVTRQRDLVVGVAIDGSTGTRYERSLGLFINTIPLRVQFSGEDTFEECLSVVGRSVIETLPYQDTPLELIVQATNVRRTTEHTPLYQAMLSFQDRAATDLPEWVERCPADIDAARLELSLFADYARQGLALSLEFDTGRISRPVARRLLDIVTSMIETASVRPGVGLRALRAAAIGSARDDGAYRHGPVISSPECFLATFDRVAASVPADTPALSCGAESLSYRELADSSRRLAAYLRARGVRRGDVVAIHLKRGVNLGVAILGIWRAGAAYLPLDPEFPPERLKFMIDDAAVPAIVSESGLGAQLLSAASVVVLDDPEGAWREAPPADGDAGGGATDAAYVLYTSGSTGQPKGVVVPHGAVANFLAAMREAPGLGKNDRLLGVTTISFDISVLELLLPLTVGARVVVATAEESIDGEMLRSLIEREGVTVMQATPSTWRTLLDAGWQGSESFRCLCGGEAFPPDLQEPLTMRCAEVWNMYGPTETTVWSACGRIHPHGRITVGRPVANTEIRVLDDDGNALPRGLAGEVWIGGAGVSAGYLNRPELTAERFQDRFQGSIAYRTGDLGRWTESGELEILGRLDDQVKVRGFRIELSEVEAGLSSCSRVQRAAVTTWDREPDDRRLVAYVVPEAGSEVSAIELRKQLRSFLPSYMVPHHFVPIDDLPLTANGKLDRNALPHPEVAVGMGRASSASEPPATETEKRIAAIWDDLIGGVGVSRGDNFFEAGGHSLLALRAIARMHEQLGWRPAPRDLILENLREIAASCDARAASVGGEPGLLSRIKGLVSGD